MIYNGKSNRTKTELYDRQERYHDAIVPLLRKELNIRLEFSRDYEGDPSSRSGISTCKIGSQTQKSMNMMLVEGASLTQSATTYLTAPVDKHFAINEIIDG